MDCVVVMGTRPKAKAYSQPTKVHCKGSMWGTRIHDSLGGGGGGGFRRDKIWLNQLVCYLLDWIASCWLIRGIRNEVMKINIWSLPKFFTQHIVLWPLIPSIWDRFHQCCLVLRIPACNSNLHVISVGAWKFSKVSISTNSMCGACYVTYTSRKYTTIWDVI